jgi:hypothetical protein
LKKNNFLKFSAFLNNIICGKSHKGIRIIPFIIATSIEDEYGYGF